MKKTYTINISGIIFHIDDDAYQVLNQYLERLTSYFYNQEDGKEIVSDIEARMAELIQEKLGDSREVISLGDVEAVIAIMGHPEQFGDEDEEEEHVASDNPSAKRFFRDLDHKMIAGVCSGLGAYFHIDPLLVRLLFLISLFAGGFGILLYFILWMVIPEAQTASEKLQMQGKPVTISSIEKTIREETANFRQRFSSKNGTNASPRDPSRSTPVEKAAKGVANVIMVFVQVLLVVIGVVIALIGIGSMIMLLVLLFGWGGSIMVDPDFMIMTLPEMMNLVLSCDMNTFFLQIALLLLLGIPLVGLMYLGIRLVLKMERIPYFGITLLNIWIIGLFACGYYGFKIYHEFKAEESVKTTTVIEQPVGDTLYIMPDKNIIEAEESYDRIALFDELWIYRDNHDQFYLPPYLMVKPSKAGEIKVQSNTIARGNNRDEAFERASSIVPKTKLCGDTLWLNGMIPLGKNDCWHGEHNRLTIEVPEGMVVYFGEGIWRHKINQHYRRVHLKKPEWYLIEENQIEKLIW
jgi:phage shock protein PspC (stress-responsive transcriptional regulator)